MVRTNERDAKTLTDTSGLGMFPAATIPMKQRRANVFIENGCIDSSCYQILFSEISVIVMHMVLEKQQPNELT